jgi:choline kinase
MKTLKFKDKIKKIIKDAGYNYKIRSWTVKCENGLYEKVVVYAGKSIEKIAQKRSRRLVAWKDEKGEWQGDMEAVSAQGGKGDSIFSLDYHDKTEPQKYEMWSDIDWKDDEEYARNKLLKTLENWSR